MFAEELFQALRVVGHAFGCFEILIEYGEWKIAQSDEGDFRARLARTFGGDGGEFLVERIAAKTAAESEDARYGHAWGLRLSRMIARRGRK